MTSRSPGLFAAVCAGTLFALAGHLGLIHAYGTSLPFRDQWQATGFEILAPWISGDLGLKNFFTVLNDHWPVLTRVLSFAVVRANGQWNNLVETTVNALLFAGCVALFLRLVLPGLQRWMRVAFAALAGLVLALPITWENTLWGIQSLVYLQVGLSLAYFAAVCTQPRFSLGWWLGHVAGLLVLFTQHSAVLAHIAAAVLLAWRAWRRDGDRRVALAGLAFALLVIAAFAAFFPSITTTAALRADTWRLAADVFHRQLAWPLPHPAWAFVVYLPWLVWIADRLTTRRLASVDAFILVCGLWVGAQAAAIGYGRAAETYTFASRYCDFLALGWLLNAACLGRLSLAFRSTLSRVAIIVFTAFWLIAPLKSFWWESTESHAGYTFLHRPDINRRNLERLQHYFATGDFAAIASDPGTQHELFTYPPSLLALWSEPKFQALLPPETGSPLARRDHGRLGWLPAVLLPAWPWIAGAGLLFLGAAMLQTLARRRETETDLLTLSSHTPAALATLGAIVLVASTGALLAWQNPGTFDRAARMRAAFAPLEEGVVLADLDFQRNDAGLDNRVAARGAVDTLPADVRQHWYGTRLKVTPDFRGILRSTPFVVRSRYLIVPFTGHPCYPGNGLRILFVDPATKKETWESYVGPDAALGWNMWTLDVSAHRGSEASLVMFDGHTHAQGWLGVARPAQTDDPTLGARWLALLRAERAETAHRALVGAALASGALLLSGFAPFVTRRLRRRSIAAKTEPRPPS